MGDLSEFGQFIKDGGTAGYVILTAGFFAAGLAIERLIRIRQYSVDSRAFMAKLKKYILSDNIDRAISLCNSKPGALLPKVLKAGLTRAKDSEADIQNAVDEATLEVLPKLEARSLYLPVLANLATLLGLFGTIVGLIMAFKGGDAVDAVQRQAFLQKAIALAMNSTAMGIMVAMPALFVNAFLQSKINGIISDIDQYSVKLINLLSASKKGGHVASSEDDSAASE
jgi:biopolymer transport protein ExbB/TolQ